MSNQTFKSGGTTITGFSKSGFGCCARHTFCSMGKTTCYYAETDQEVQLLCAAYKRNHITSSTAITLPEVEVKIVEKISIGASAAISLNEDDNGQLSLF